MFLITETKSTGVQTFCKREGSVEPIDRSEKSFVLTQGISCNENSVPRFELAGRHLERETETQSITLSTVSLAEVHVPIVVKTSRHLHTAPRMLMSRHLSSVRAIIEILLL